MAAVLDNAQSLRYFLPETILTIGAVALILLDLVVAKHQRRVAIVTAVSFGFLLLAAIFTFLSSIWPNPVDGATAMQKSFALFNGLIVLDPWGLFFKYIAWVATGLAIWMAAPSLEISADRMGQYCALLLSIAVGLSLMSTATDALMIVIGIELVSMVSYALAGFRKHNRRSSEAALKYVVYGGVASGMMLFGVSYIYGLVGSTNIVGLASLVKQYQERAYLANLSGANAGAWAVALILAVVLILSGIGYKIASVPWHMWCPDVYEGAPTPFTAFLSVGPKAAGFALAVRIFYGAMSTGGEDLADAVSGVPWPAIIGIISAVTMTLGNFAALNQTNLKRMLAYSSIAHAGYLLMGLAAASATGSTSVAIYLVVYLFMNLGAFLVVGTVSRLSGSETIFEYRGLSARAPFAAVAFAIFLFSLTGLPPLAGFVGKFHLFKSVIDRGGTWYVALALLGVMNSAVSLYYYARIVKAMFLDQPMDAQPIRIPRSYNVLLGVLVFGVVFFGVYFNGLRQIAQSSVHIFGRT